MGRKKPKGWLERAIDGVAEAAYPPGHQAPDYLSTDMAGRMKTYIATLPPGTSFQIKLLYFFIEFLSLPIAPRLGRFSKMKVHRRRAALERWSASKYYYIRILGDAVKANQTMLYLSHPAVLAYLHHFKNCQNKDDPFTVKIKHGPLGDWKPKKRTGKTQAKTEAESKAKSKKKTKTRTAKKPKSRPGVKAKGKSKKAARSKR